MQTFKILLLDQATRSRQRMIDSLDAQGWKVELVEDLSSALALGHDGVDAVLAEKGIGGEELALAWELKGDHPPILLMDAFASRAESIPPGVTEILRRPLPEHALIQALERAFETNRLRQGTLSLVGDETIDHCFGELVTRDPGMQRIFQLLATVADSQATILIQGESGTGKSALARAIHTHSNRKAGPFVGVNCGALPETLLASELFGHVKGAFTGAIADRTGKYESAHEGTLFLDEIGTAPMDLQVKLLRVLEEGRFERVGDSATREADVRVVAATNVDLEEEVASRAFRSDLYYRLNVVSVELPPLRQRPTDVLLLADRFVRKFALCHRRRVKGIDPRGLRSLTDHDWPGNVRELQNTIERAVLLAAGDTLGLRDLWPSHKPREAGQSSPPMAWDLPEGVSLKEAVNACERWCIEQALLEESGSRTRTAKRLGINRTTLFNKMRKYALLSDEHDSMVPDPERRSG